MTLRTVPIAIMLLFFAKPLSANPISNYDVAVIAEVQWIDPTTWSIEISNRVHILDLNEGETGTIKLYIASSNRFYTFRISLNESNLGVITPDSLVGNESRPVTIEARDAIFLPSPEVEPQESSAYRYLINENEGALEDGWFCRIDSPVSGHSLIGLGKGAFFESCHNSIGSTATYSTINNLLILDRDSLPIPGINLFSENKSYESMFFHPVFTKRTNSDENGTVSRSASIGTRSNSSIYSSTCYIYDNEKFCDGYSRTRIPYWRPSYNDTATETFDTLLYAPNFHIISVKNENDNPVSTLTPYFLFDSTFPIMNIRAAESCGVGNYRVCLFPDADCTISFYNLTDSIGTHP